MSIHTPPPAWTDRLVSEPQAAEILGVRPQTLAVWRCTRRYPLAWSKIGACVRYRMSDLQAFIAARTVTPTTPR